MNASLISGILSPHEIAVSGDNLFVAELAGAYTIGEFTISGDTVSADFLPLSPPYAFAVVPEPSSIVLAASSVGGLMLLARDRKKGWTTKRGCPVFQNQV